MVQRQREKLVMRLPTSADATPGITVPPDLWQQMADAALAAVTADAVANAHVLHADSAYPSGQKRHRPLPAVLSISPAH